MGDNVITSFGVLNYSGMLFNKGNTRVPFSTMIANKRKDTNHVEFVTGLEFATGGGTQPNISENDSLTAPDATFITRAQKTNVTQIFQESVYISYAKQSNMGTLSGINIANQNANPANELDFQVAAKMNKIARDIEYTFINGAYVKAKDDDTANRTRGMMTAITTNIVDLGGEGLRVWDVAEAMKTIYDSQAPTSGLVLWVDPYLCSSSTPTLNRTGLSIVPSSRTVNGLSISTLLTPLGEIGVYLGEFLPAGSVGIFNPDMIGRVEQPVPNKGNWFLEELAKTGAGAKYQIFGQLGLDHGPEWTHAKITGINTGFIKPKPGKRIYAIDPLPVAETLPVIESAEIVGSPKVGVASKLEIGYTVEPTDTPTLAYKWKIATAPNGSFANISGATSATYEPQVGDVDKYIKCEITATGTAKGVFLTPSKKVAAAD